MVGGEQKVWRDISAPCAIKNLAPRADPRPRAKRSLRSNSIVEIFLLFSMSHYLAKDRLVKARQLIFKQGLFALRAGAGREIIPTSAVAGDSRHAKGRESKMMVSQQWREIERAVEVDDHVLVKELARQASKNGGQCDLGAWGVLISLGARAGAVRSVKILVDVWHGMGGVALDPNMTGGSPLTNAAKCRTAESAAALAKILLPWSKDPGKGAGDRDPLLIAAVKGYAEAAKIFIASHFYGGNIDWQNNTLLHCAVMSGSSEMLAVALSAPGSAQMLGWRNCLGKTPSSLARAMLYPEIEAALRLREGAEREAAEIGASSQKDGPVQNEEMIGKRRSRL